MFWDIILSYGIIFCFLILLPVFHKHGVRMHCCLLNADLNDCVEFCMELNGHLRLVNVWLYDTLLLLLLLDNKLLFSLPHSLCLCLAGVLIEIALSCCVSNRMSLLCELVRFLLRKDCVVVLLLVFILHGDL